MSLRLSPASLGTAEHHASRLTRFAMRAGTAAALRTLLVLAAACGRSTTAPDPASRWHAGGAAALIVPPRLPADFDASQYFPIDVNRAAQQRYGASATAVLTVDHLYGRKASVGGRLYGLDMQRAVAPWVTRWAHIRPLSQLRRLSERSELRELHHADRQAAGSDLLGRRDHHGQGDSVLLLVAGPHSVITDLWDQADLSEHRGGS